MLALSMVLAPMFIYYYFEIAEHHAFLEVLGDDAL